MPAPTNHQVTPVSLAKELCSYYPGAQDAETQGKFASIRQAAEALVAIILHVCPCSPDRTTAVQHVRDAMQRAIASLVVPQEAVLAISTLGR